MRAKWSMLFGPEGSIILWPKGSILFGQRGQICLAFPQGASLFIYIGSHLALEKRLKKILSRTCMFQKCVVLLHPQSKGDTVVS